MNTLNKLIVAFGACSIPSRVGKASTLRQAWRAATETERKWIMRRLGVDVPLCDMGKNPSQCPGCRWMKRNRHELPARVRKAYENERRQRYG